MMSVDHQQLYLRAEPSEEGRETLLTHRRRVHEVLHALHLTPQFVERNNFHRTELFLGAPRAWRRAFAAIGVPATVTRDDLLDLLNLPLAERRVAPGTPLQYDAFFTGGTAAVFVLRLGRVNRDAARVLLQRITARLRRWETEARVPRGSTRTLLAHPASPLARERGGGKPHVTLARGHVSLTRQRDVARTLHGTPLADDTPIPFVSMSIRAVRSAIPIAPYAP